MSPKRTQDLLSKKQLLDIFVHHRVDSPFSGDWESIFKGAGFEFWGLREMLPTDSYKHIDWKATARTGAYHVREHLAESYVNLMLLYDISNSVSFGRKERFQANIAVSLAYTAAITNNGCGLILFADEVVDVIPPRMGWPHFMRIVSAIARAVPIPCKTTRLNRALSKLVSELPESLTFIISDFLYPIAPDGNHGLGPLHAGRHELRGLQVLETFETALPPGGVGVLQLYDYETGWIAQVDLRHWKAFNRLMDKRLAGIRRELSRAGIKLLTLTPEDNFQAEISAFMKRPHRKEGVWT